MTAKNKGGRPPSLKADEKTLKQIRGLGQIQATTKECAAVLGVSEPTFLKFKNSNPKVADALEQGQYSGKASLRRMQFNAAKKGNSTMLVWLGKQLLGQRDKKEITGPGGGPVQNLGLDPEKLREMSPDELNALESALGRLASSTGSGEDGEGQT